MPAKRPKSRFDEIGSWSEIKLDIVREYAKAYSTILAAQSAKGTPFSHVYIDAFAGSGQHFSKAKGRLVPGSPLIALDIEPKFDEYFFIDLNSQKIAELEQIARERSDVHVLHGDCNTLLPEQVFPRVRWENFRRALCLLDPYRLNLNWDIIAAAGGMRSIDLLLNFPVMDMNRNALWRESGRVSAAGVKRMNAFWGDESWRKIVYKPEPGLFQEMDLSSKRSNQAIVEAFRSRLKEVARFQHVPKPIPMRNSTNAVVYYLFFASQKPAAEKIARQIFKKYANEEVADG
jgi:three-Cys-motif partner protein